MSITFIILTAIALTVFMGISVYHGSAASKQFSLCYSSKDTEKYNSYWKEYCYHQSICRKMAIPGILSAIFCFTSVMSLIIGIEKEGNIARRYDELVNEAEKAEWLNSSYGISVSNEICKVLDSAKSISNKNRSYIFEEVMRFKFENAKTTPLILSFNGNDYEDKIREATHISISNDMLIFEKEIKREKEVEYEVSVPGKILENEIIYMKINGKDVYSHKEKRKVKKFTSETQRTCCKMS